MRILCISPNFPPLSGAESFCSGKMVLALLEAGADVTVLAATPPPNQVDPSSLWAPLAQDGVTVHVAEHRSGLRGGIREVRAYISAARRLLAASHHDCIYTRSNPTFSHLVGLRLKRMTGLPWIANFNDPFHAGVRPVPFRTRERGVAGLVKRRLLRAVFRRADAVGFTCQRLADAHVRAVGHKPSGRLVVTPHVNWAVTQDTSSDRFVVVHAGNLMSEGRHQAAFLDGFSTFLAANSGAQELATLKAIGIGSEFVREWAVSHGLEGNVITTSGVSYEESLKEMARCTVALLIEGSYDEGIFFPAKLADYLAAHKPVLAVSPAVGTVNDMLTTYGGGLRVDYHDVNGIARALDTLFEAWRQGRLAQFASARYGYLSPSAVGAEFLRVCAAVAAHIPPEPADAGALEHKVQAIG